MQTSLPASPPFAGLRHLMASGRLTPWITTGGVLLAYAGSVLSLWPQRSEYAPALWGSVVMFAVNLTLLGALWLGRLSLRGELSALIQLNTAYLILKLLWLLFTGAEESLVLWQLASDYVWLITIPMLSLSVPVSPQTRRVAQALPVALTLTVTLRVLSPLPRLGTEVLTALWQTCLVNWTVLIAMHFMNRLHTELASAREQNFALAQAVWQDELTGLLSRRGLERQLGLLLAEAQRRQEVLGVLLLDIDNFKPINEVLGHEAGDELLRQLGARLRQLSSGWGQAARSSGDEFVVVIQGGAGEGGEAQARARAHELHAALSSDFHVGGQSLRLSSSAGLSLYPRDGLGAQDLLRRAAIATDSVKASGRGRVRAYDAPLHAGTEWQQRLSRELEGALGRGELWLAFQPIYHLGRARVTRCEALLRWDHPQLGAVPPATFIPVAESSGALVALGEWVLDEALGAAAQWRAQGWGELRVAVNLSPVQLLHPQFVSQVEAALARSGLSGDVLEFEITEGLPLGDHGEVAELLGRLHALGIELSLDDFGEGFASFTRLRDLPVQTFKLDRSFAQGLQNGDEGGESAEYARTLIRASVMLGETLGRGVVAEGIERPEQHFQLLALGCEEAQGYWFSPPAPLPELLTRLPAREAALRQLLTERPPCPGRGRTPGESA